MVNRVPLGICYLSSYLKKDGHQIKIFDTTFIKCSDIKSDDELRESSLQVRNPDFEKYELVERDADVTDELKCEVEAFKPDLIAMSVVDPNYNFGLELLKIIKKINKNLITVVGGPTATYAPDEVIKEDCIDIVCIGEGEEAMRDLCNKMQQGKDFKDTKNMWIKEDGKIFKNDIRQLLDVNEILPPDWDIFDHRHLIRPLGGKMYRMGIFSMTRGCVFRCEYCTNSALVKIYNNKGKYYRIKKPDLLVQEIASYSEKYNLDYIFFTDDLFPLHKEEIMNDFSKLYKEHVGIPFNISLHPDLVKEEPFAKIVDAGCSNICVGLESGSPKVRKELLKRNYKNDQIVNVFNLARKYKIRSSSFNMIGIPYENRRNIFETIELNRKAKPTTATLTFFHPYRGSELRNMCIKEKYFDSSKEKEYESVYRVESCLNLPHISKESLSGLFKTFQLYVKLPKILYSLIWIAEGDSFFAKIVFVALKQYFYRIVDDESKWEFKKNIKRNTEDCRAQADEVLVSKG